MTKDDLESVLASLPIVLFDIDDKPQDNSNNSENSENTENTPPTENNAQNQDWLEEPNYDDLQDVEPIQQNDDEIIDIDAIAKEIDENFRKKAMTSVSIFSR